MNQKESILPAMEFGNTGHISTRTLFGAAALWDVTQYEADKTFELLMNYGVNHIDTARSYGDAELRIGPLMKRQRDDFFLATKTGKRTKKEAEQELRESLKRLQTEYVDLWQMHFLVDEDEWQTAMGPGGALEAFIEAKEQGLVRFLGVTGHGFNAPEMHMKSLERYPFDAVLFPFNYMMMKNSEYASSVRRLLAVCRKNRIAVQTIKAIARKAEKEDENLHTTWYEPLTEADAIQKAVHWVLQESQVFLNTAGDIDLLPYILEAANKFSHGPGAEEMEKLEKTFGLEPLFRKQE